MGKKNLSSPQATGHVGPRFETCVQVAFTILMRSGGYAPCFSGFPITEIQLQGRKKDYQIDDMIVTVEDNKKNQRKLFAEIKKTIRITNGDENFGKVINAAWIDFNNRKIFTPDKDVIALITGPLSAADEKNVQWLLWQAKSTESDEFFEDVERANFSPPQAEEKLEVIEEHLKTANDGIDVPRDILHKFLNHFYIFDYDLGEREGVVLSLVHSHLLLSERYIASPRQIWATVYEYVQGVNTKAGKITRNNLPEEVEEVFKQREVKHMPQAFRVHAEKEKADWAQHPDAKYLALAVLIGGWNEENENDINIIGQMFDIGYDVWLQKARDILNSPDTPLSYKNGIWQVVNKVSLLEMAEKHIFDSHLESFKDIAVSVLKEVNPAFEMPPEERYLASIKGKVLSYSGALRLGIAEGLALLRAPAIKLKRCSLGKAERINNQVICEIFTQADSNLWGSLDYLLPDLAESAPDAFLNAINESLKQSPCPFAQLFAQEGKDFFGEGHYLTGLLWALERLAWDEEYLVEVCILLSKLIKHDSGGRSLNRPSNSLVTIFLPWCPQTLAPAAKRKVAIERIFKEHPDIAWKLILQLLPKPHSSSFGCNKPKWRQSVPEEISVTQQEYWEQSIFYADLAVTAAGHDIEKLSELIDCFDNLPKDVFNRLIAVLSSEAISELPEEQRLPLWERLTKFAHQHRKCAHTNWALPGEYVVKIETVAEKLQPINPFHLYQYLFLHNTHELYDGEGSWEEQRKRLDIKRENAVNKIFQQEGMKGIMRFTDSVDSSFEVGCALTSIESDEVQKILFPDFLKEGNHRHENLARGFIRQQQSINGWEWGDNLDKSEWTPVQIGYFLACLPFAKQTWERACQWLGENEREYWIRVDFVYPHNDISIAIDKFLKYDKPYMAINCLHNCLHGNKSEQPIDVNQCIKALHAILPDKSPGYKIDTWHITELIRFLQSNPDTPEEDLFNLELSYLPLLSRFGSAAQPKTIERRLANEPAFFHYIIGLVYRSKKESEPRKELSEQEQAIVMHVYNLLRNWRILPGIKDGILNSEEFNKWLQQVKELCSESGHLGVAMMSFGEILIHAPSDPGGLWIHRTVAAALNAKDVDDMRSGFTSGIRNSRGVHTVDPTGEQEKALAKKYHEKADAVEKAGFHKLADSLRKEVAKYYEQEAQRVIDEHSD